MRPPTGCFAGNVFLDDDADRWTEGTAVVRATRRTFRVDLSSGAAPNAVV